MSHVIMEFNQEVLLELSFCNIREAKRVVLKIVDEGTAYYETPIVKDRHITTTTAAIEEIWLSRHGAPRSLYADDGFDAT